MARCLEISASLILVTDDRVSDRASMGAIVKSILPQKEFDRRSEGEQNEFTTIAAPQRLQVVCMRTGNVLTRREKCTQSQVVGACRRYGREEKVDGERRKSTEVAREEARFCREVSACSEQGGSELPRRPKRQEPHVTAPWSRLSCHLPSFVQALAIDE